jgi:hypothetical protein
MCHPKAFLFEGTTSIHEANAIHQCAIQRLFWVLLQFMSATVVLNSEHYLVGEREYWVVSILYLYPLTIFPCVDIISLSLRAFIQFVQKEPNHLPNPPL